MKIVRVVALLVALVVVILVSPLSYGGDPGLSGQENRDLGRYLQRLKFMRMKRPEDASLSYKIGNVYDSLQMEDEAIKEYRRTLRLQSDHQDAKWFLSKNLVSKGYFEEGFLLVRELMDVDANNPDLYEWAGEILVKLDLHDLAKEYFARVDLLIHGETQEGKRKLPVGGKFF